MTTIIQNHQNLIFSILSAKTALNLNENKMSMVQKVKQLQLRQRRRQLLQRQTTNLNPKGKIKNKYFLKLVNGETIVELLDSILFFIGTICLQGM